MMLVHANNLKGALSASLSADAVEMQVDAGLSSRLGPLLSAADMLLTLAEVDLRGVEIGWEIVRATGIAGSTVQIQRGEGGSSARSWPAGALISARLTAGVINALVRRAGRVERLTGDHVLTAADDGACLVAAGPVRVPDGLPDDWAVEIVRVGDALVYVVGGALVLRAGCDPAVVRGGRLKLQALGGGELALTGDLSPASDPVVLVRQQGDLFRVTASGVAVVAGDVQACAIAPDGTQRVDVLDDGSVWLRPVLGGDGAGVQIAAPTVEWRDIWGGWSADSRLLAVSTLVDDSYVLTVFDRAGSVVESLPDEFGSTPAWAGSWLVGGLADGLRVLSADGWQSTDLLAGTVYMAVAGSRGRVALVAAGGNIEVRGVPAGALLPGPDLTGGVSAVRVAWSAAGDMLAAHCADGYLRVWRAADWVQIASVEVGIPPLQSPGVMGGHIVWSPDGLQVAVLIGAAPWVMAVSTADWQLSSLAALPYQSDLLTVGRG